MILLNFHGIPCPDSKRYLLNHPTAMCFIHRETPDVIKVDKVISDALVDSSLTLKTKRRKTLTTTNI